jgi:hypothetical protein
MSFLLNLSSPRSSPPQRFPVPGLPRHEPQNVNPGSLEEDHACVHHIPANRKVIGSLFLQICLQKSQVSGLSRLSPNRTQNPNVSPHHVDLKNMIFHRNPQTLMQQIWSSFGIKPSI